MSHNQAWPQHQQQQQLNLEETRKERNRRVQTANKVSSNVTSSSSTVYSSGNRRKNVGWPLPDASVEPVRRPGVSKACPEIARNAPMQAKDGIVKNSIYPGVACIMTVGVLFG